MRFTDIIRKLNEKFEPLFNKLQAGYFGILLAGAGLITIFTCIILFSMSEPVSFFTHWLSDLGGIVTNSGGSPNGSNIVFSLGLISMTIIAIPFMISLANFLISKDQKLQILVSLAFIFSIITLIGIVGVSFIDIKTDPYIHTLFATLFFFGGMAIMFFFSLAMLFNSDISWKQGLIGIICASVPVLFLSTFTPFLLRGENIFDLVISVDPALALTRFLEWMYFFALVFWFLEVGVYLIKNK